MASGCVLRPLIQNRLSCLSSGDRLPIGLNVSLFLPFHKAAEKVLDGPTPPSNGRSRAGHCPNMVLDGPTRQEKMLRTAVETASS